MGAEETDRMLALLERLKPGHAILLVEHDMDAVFRIAERITVMVNGAVIATGSPDAIRNDPQDLHTYYGDSHILRGIAKAMSDATKPPRGSLPE
ncbi:hypothetical protein KXX11_004012 [Aspergillus fumigatus]|nr:hypothetical protein KXX11_004012 [Aspergillus fumigatus]